MIKNFFVIVFVTWFFGTASAFALSEVAPTLDIGLASNFDSQFHCGWKSQKPLKFWMDSIEDAREEKEVGVLIQKDKETPLQSTRPVVTVLQEALEKGLKKCGFSEANQKNLADIIVTGRLETFSGTSKKGLLKGKAEGKADFTLNLSAPQTHEQFSVLFGVEETREKGVSRKPKKLEEILNNLLTRLTLDVFQSRQVTDWFASRK